MAVGQDGQGRQGRQGHLGAGQQATTHFGLQGRLQSREQPVFLSYLVDADLVAFGVVQVRPLALFGTLQVLLGRVALPLPHHLVHSDVAQVTQLPVVPFLGNVDISVAVVDEVLLFKGGWGCFGLEGADEVEVGDGGGEGVVEEEGGA